MTNTEPRKETIVRWFSYQHLPEKMQPASKIFADMVATMLVMCPTPDAERTVAFRMLLQSKDAFVRACIVNAEAAGE
jgi:hypothetical protein